MTSRRLAACVGLLACLGSPAHAQQTTRFVTGPLGWTPTIQLKDAGLDSNVYNEPRAAEDQTATLLASVAAEMTLAHFKVQGTAVGDYVYFRRLTGERVFERKFNLRVEAPTRRIVPFVAAAYERAKQRLTPEIDAPAFFQTRTLGAGTSIFVMPRGAILIAGRREETRYDFGQIRRSVDIAERFNRATDTGTLGFRFNVTDLTAISADAHVFTDRFDLRPALNTWNVAWSAQVEFAPDAVLKGRAGVGYHIMEPRGAEASSFRGGTANVDLAYVLLGRTQFNGRFFHDTTFSLEEPYYVLTALSGEVTQLIGGPFELIFRAGRQRSDYPENPVLKLPPRIDLLDTIAGGFGLRFSDTTRSTVTYELARRLTPVDAIRYDRRRLLTSITYGF